LFGPLLAAGPRAFTPEVLSYPSDRPLGYDGLEAHVRAALPAAPFALVAESFSGPLAIRIAARPPPGLAAVVLVATFLHRPVAPALGALAALAGPRLFGHPPPRALIRRFLSGPDAPPEIVEAVRSAVAELRPDVAARRAAEGLRTDVRDALGESRVPLLAILPTRDRLLRRGGLAEELRARRPDAEIAEIDGPHLILQRQPHACLARIEPFLAARASAATGG
jgi:pimeloyl-ACP methyl ester carboxylesterase